MTSHPRGLHHAPRNKALGLAVALAIGAGACVDAQAARAGHARVVSAPGAPMQIEIPLLELSADEAATLQVQLADAAAWQRAGLQPPAPLADTRVSVEGTQPDSRMLRIRATQPITTETVDLLLELRSSAGQRQMQVTLLVPARDAAAGVRRASVGQPAASTSRGVQEITVRSGQTLSGIAVRHAVADASLYQMLAALWQANPQAFIQNNMNLVRAGESLKIPDAATVRAIDPAEARRIFLEHVAAYERYRGRLGAVGQDVAPAAGADGASGQVERANGGQASVQPAARDRLRLSNASAAQGAAGSDASADARTSDERAIDDARQRVDTLQSNVDALRGAAGAQQGGRAAVGGSGPATASGSGAGTGQGSAAPTTSEQPGGTQAAGGAGTSASGGSGPTGQSSTNAASGASGGAAPEGAAPGGSAAGSAGSAAGGAAAGGPAGGGKAAGSGAAAGGAASTGAASGAAPASAAAGSGGSDSGAASPAPGTAAPAASTPAGGQASGAPAGTSGANPATGSAPAAGSAASGSASNPQPGQTATEAGTSADSQAKDGMPSWLADNLLAVVTAVLALLVFVVAWMLRRAGARRSDEVEAVDYGDPPPFDSRAFSRKLDAIDLDLNHPPTDEPPPGRRA